MSDVQDLNSQRTWMMERWHEYGKAFTAFVPDEQRFPEEWEPVLPGPDDKGRLSPQALKHWEHLFPTKQFLRQRYAEHHILEGPSFRFDCLVPKFQRRMRYRVAEDEHGHRADPRPLHPRVGQQGVADAYCLTGQCRFIELRSKILHLICMLSNLDQEGLSLLSCPLGAVGRLPSCKSPLAQRAIRYTTHDRPRNSAQGFLGP